MRTTKLLLMAIKLVVLGSFPAPHVFCKVNNLQGKELRVITAHRPPAISVLRNASGHVVGYSDQFYYQLLYLSQKLKFTFQIFPSKDTNGIKINGTWNGLIGTVLRDEADLALAAFAISQERYEAIEFCGSIGGADTAILVRYPEPKLSFTAAFDVFSIGIWASWLISGAGIVAIFIVLINLAKRLRVGVDETRVWRAGTVAWFLFGSIVSQGNHFPLRQSSLKVLIATWGVVAFVFVNIYNSTLTSYMSVTYQRLTINSFEDLAANPNYKATVLTGSIQEIDLQGSSIEALKVVSNRIQKCPADCRKLNYNDMVTPVLDKDNYVSILPGSVGISLLQKYNSEKGECRLAVVNVKLSWKPMFYAVQKSFPYKEEINRESLWFIDTGLRDYWYGKYEKMPKECQLNYNRKGVAAKRTSNRIKLEQFYLPFLILFFGYLMAFVQFCREKFILPLKNRVG